MRAVSDAGKALPAVALPQLCIGPDRGGTGLTVAAELLPVGFDQFVEAVCANHAVSVCADAVGQRTAAVITTAVAFVPHDRDVHLLASVCDDVYITVIGYSVNKR